jgi:hypothetical protein
VTDNSLRACMLGLYGLSIVCLSALVATGHNSVITDALMALCGGVGTLGLWERLKQG